MELNTINKTGTWGEAADRLNNNFSKTSTEVEKSSRTASATRGCSLLLNHWKRLFHLLL